MTQYIWIVYTNAAEGTDEEFNKWYDEVHVPDLLKIPGVVKAERFKVADWQSAPRGELLEVVPVEEAELPHRYLAVYTIESDDPAAVLREISSKATSEMSISETLKESSTILFAPLS
jgi:hypothetical protein